MGKRNREPRRAAAAATPAPEAPASSPAPPPPGVAAWWAGLRPLRQTAAVCAAVCAVALLVYSNSFSGGLVLDNRVIIEHDTRLREFSLPALRLIFTTDYWWPFLASDLYRPLTTLTYLFNYSILGNGTNPEGYHAVNFLLHAANIGMVVVILQRLTGRLALAGLAGALFAVLPVNVESVTNIVGRADLLATLSTLVAGWCYLRSTAAAEGRERAVWLAAMAGVSTLGMFAKESAVMICAFVILYDFFWRWPALVEGRNLPRTMPAWPQFCAIAAVGGTTAAVLLLAWKWISTPWLAQLHGLTAAGVIVAAGLAGAAVGAAGGSLWLWALERWCKPAVGRAARVAAREFAFKGWLPLAPGLLLFFTVRDWLLYNSPVFNQIFVDNPIAYAAPVAGFLTAMKVVGLYLGLLVFPATLSCDYSYNQVPLYGEGAPWQDAQCWLGLAVTLALLGAAWALRRRQPVFAWGTAFFFLMLLPTSNLLIKIGSIMGERFLYLPSIGYCAVAAWALLGAGRWLGARLAHGPAKLRPAGVALACAPALAAVFLYGARSRARNADWRDDLTLWQSAVAASPNSFKVYKGLSNALSAADKSEAGQLAALQSALRGLAVLDQRELSAERRDNTLFHDLGMAHRLYGEVLENNGQTAAAREQYLEALKVFDRAIEVDRLVNESSRSKRLERGVPLRDIADVGNHRIYIQDGLAAARAGDWARMERSGRHIQRLAPSDVMGYRITGAALFNQGRPLAAAEQYLQALLLEGKDAESWQNLARCFEVARVVPQPVQMKPGGEFALDQGVPAARAALNGACVQLIQRYDEAKQRDNAAIWRERVLAVYGVPPEAIPPPPN